MYPNGEHDNWSSQGQNGYQYSTGGNAYRDDSAYFQSSSSQLPPKPEAESTVQTIPGSDRGNKWKRRCSRLVIALAIALVVACAVAVALGTVLGVTIQQKQDSQSEINALHASIFASEVPTSTATSLSPSVSQEETEDISMGCSAEEGEVSDTTYTSECNNPNKCELIMN